LGGYSHHADINSRRAKKRVRLPDAKPLQVFAYTNNGDGSFTLTVVKAERKPAFPRDSLLKYFTPDRNKQELERAAACSLEVPPK
jgi:hypothetical protein